MKSIIVYENIYESSIRLLSKKKVVLDIGGFAPFKGVDPGRKSQLINYKNLFDKTQYYCLDVLTEGNPQILGDAMILPIKNESIDGILCYAVLEHIIEPQKAVNEIFRVLNKGGGAFFYVPFLDPYHAEPMFKDYHRFTEDIILHMFRDFNEVTIQSGENFAKTSIRFMTAFSQVNYLKVLERPLEFLFKHFARHDRVKNTTGFHIYAIK